MLLDLSTEVINEIFSFLTIQECEYLNLIVDNVDIKNILNSNIYGRIILYLNDESNSLSGNNKLTQMMFKYVDMEFLKRITAIATNRNGCNAPEKNKFNVARMAANVNDNRYIIPKRFVLSYSYNRCNYNDDEHDPFLKDFNDILPKVANFIMRIGTIEISIDLFNKKFDSGEVEYISNILNNQYVNYNLTYLNLARFHRLPESCTTNLNECIKANLHKFVHLHTLSLASNRIINLDGFRFPESVLFLTLDNNKLTELPNHLPPNLIKLNLSCNYIKDLSQVTFPDSLQYLDIQLNEVRKLNMKFPSNLKVLIACSNNIIFEDDEIVKFPDGLRYLNLLQNPFLNCLKTLDINTCLTTIYIDAVYQHKSTNNAITFI